MRAIFASSLRGSDESRTVTPLELFFDLVFVFAVSQLTHLLVAHFDARGAIEALILTLAVVYAWYMTAWVTNWMSPGHLPVQALLLTIMLLSLLMSSGIDGAFIDNGWLFVIPYVVIQVGRAAFATVTFTPGSNQHIHFVNVLLWELAVTVLWIAGAFADGDTRIALWALAVLALHAGVAVFHAIPGRPSSHLRAPIGPDARGVHSDVAGEHVLERLRLLFLIALGETLITTGATFASADVTIGPIAALVNAFLASVALWYLYFQRVEGVGLQANEASEDASGIASVGTHAITLVFVALIAIAVGDEFAIAHPGGEPSAGYIALVFGGPALFLLSQIWFMWRVGATGLKPRILGVPALAVLAVATYPTSLLLASIAATAVLVAVAAKDVRSGASLALPGFGSRARRVPRVAGRRGRAGWASRPRRRSG